MHKSVKATAAALTLLLISAPALAYDKGKGKAKPRQAKRQEAATQFGIDDGFTTLGWKQSLNPKAKIPQGVDPVDFCRRADQRRAEEYAGPYRLEYLSKLEHVMLLPDSITDGDLKFYRESFTEAQGGLLQASFASSLRSG